MGWTVKLSDSAERELGKLDATMAKRVTRYMRERVLVAPDPRKLAQPLAGNLQGYWRYRVGDYRIVCELHESELIVLVITIGHRKDVYHH